MIHADWTYGNLTGPIVGLAMKEIVGRAIAEIRSQQRGFEANAKLNLHKPDKEDFVTSADKAAQAIYIKLLKEAFPGFGIVAEENELSMPCTLEGQDLWFSVDPLDGTKAFIRRQSHGIGTMLALMRGDQVIGAYVGDVMTREIYGFRPGSNKVHRIVDGQGEQLVIDNERPFKSQTISLREELGKYSKMVQIMLQAPDAMRIDKGYEMTSGSIGIHFARLWKGEIGMIILVPSTNTPWDLMPILGISEKLGFEFLTVFGTDRGRRPFRVSRDAQANPNEVFVFHASRRTEIERGLDRLFPLALRKAATWQLVFVQKISEICSQRNHFFFTWPRRRKSKTRRTCTVIIHVVSKNRVTCAINATWGCSICRMRICPVTSESRISQIPRKNMPRINHFSRRLKRFGFD